MLFYKLFDKYEPKWFNNVKNNGTENYKMKKTYCTHRPFDD